MQYFSKKICVVGGGAAGMMAAGTAKLYGAEVTIFENTDRLGKKLAITGKGRCNVTNNCTTQEFLENVTKNPRFLFAALNAFDTESTISFFENLGVKLKTERGKRVYPETDRAKDIVDVFFKTNFSKIDRYIKRINQIKEYEENQSEKKCEINE